MPTNDFLPFCPTDTGTNLDTQVEYAAASDRTAGNQPGVAKSKLVNKALRQPTYIAGQVAQLLANTTGTDVLDDATPAKLLSQMMATLTFYPSALTVYTSGSGTHGLSYVFFIASGSATAAATYTNNGNTFTVISTVASGTVIKMKGPGAPLASGTLTKASGTGDATLTFYSVRAPMALKVKLAGAGGGGGQSGTNSTGTAGGDGTDTTFGSLTGGKGSGGSSGSAGGSGGTASGGDINITGSQGQGCGRQGASVACYPMGGSGGSTAFGGAGLGGGYDGAGHSASAYGGSGGGGGGGNDGTTNNIFTGSGGGAGGYVEKLINGPAVSYAYSVGTGGAGGGAGTTGFNGGSASNGLIIVEEFYQ